MKKIFTILVAAALMLPASAEQCDMNVCVVTPSAANCGGSEQVANQLALRLMRALTTDGVTGDADYGQFYVTGRFDDTFRETVEGTPTVTVVNTTLTLMMTDFGGSKVLASKSFELKGSGSNMTRAYMSALNGVNRNNAAFKEFVAAARQKAIAYFDANWETLLKRAASAAAVDDIEQALYYTTLIPECSRGYSRASEATIKYYTKYADEQGAKLLARARAAFAQSPDGDGMATALEYIDAISPSSASYEQAMKFVKEMAQQAHTEYNYQNHKKYEDAQARRMAEIDAARQIGVAYGRGQQSTTTNVLWK